MLTGAVLRVVFSVLFLQVFYECSMFAPKRLCATNLLIMPVFRIHLPYCYFLLRRSLLDDDMPLSWVFIGSIVPFLTLDEILMSMSQTRITSTLQRI